MPDPSRELAPARLRHRAGRSAVPGLIASVENLATNFWMRVYPIDPAIGAPAAATPGTLQADAAATTVRPPARLLTGQSSHRQTNRNRGLALGARRQNQG